MFKALWIVVAVILLIGCGGTPLQTKDISTGNTVLAEAPTSESGIPYTVAANAALPVDERIYYISGKVIAGVESLTRQTTPALGGISGYNGYTSGYYIGPSVNGKSFVRILVSEIKPSDTDWVSKGQIVIIKGTDTKMTALLPGDNVQFMCRRQAEAIAAIHPGEWYNPDNNTTWELDYCRMASPVIVP